MHNTFMILFVIQMIYQSGFSQKLLLRPMTLVESNIILNIS